jgi:hypothetical protein
MILQIDSARLGNKLFQHAGLKKYFPNEKIIFFGFENNQDFFNNVNSFFFGRNKISKLFFYLFKKIIFFFISLRLLGLITEDTKSKNFQINVKRGLLNKIFVSHSNFFQHNDVISNIENPLYIKSNLRTNAQKWLRSKNKNIKNNTLVFVHIRRGDYLRWPSNEFPAALDIGWYKRAINMMLEKLKNPIFIIVGDDKNYLYKQFRETNKLFISNNTSELDLSIMSLCSAGILSASSFAWWGAYYAKMYNYKEINYFLAPKFWIGHRKKKWSPKNFYSNWIEYID